MKPNLPWLCFVIVQNQITSVLLNLKLVSEPKNNLYEKYEIQKHNELIFEQS